MIKAEQVEWIVNNLGELGVKIGDQCFFLYKGHSLMYLEPTNEDDGSPMMYRRVGKREFGECCTPEIQPSITDGGDWKPLPRGTEELRGY